MKARIVVLALSTLCFMAWGAGDAAVAPQQGVTGAPVSPKAVSSADAVTIPQMISYQGKLTDTFDLPVADTTYSVAFRLYTQPTGGSPFWNETQTVRTRGGLFSTLLGSVTPIGSMPDAGTAYLGMAVGGGAELAPRLRIASAAYAYKADTANYALAGGTADNAWARGTPDSVLYTIHRLGIARGEANNMLYGTNRFTHVNLGVACTTGTSGQNYSYATVGGGNDNDATGSYATVGGGNSNTAGDNYVTVGGGLNNDASQDYATVSGGSSNAASNLWATVGGGYNNDASQNYATVGGGWGNTASGIYATAAGGRADTVMGAYGGVLSGSGSIAGDAAADTGAVVAGGSGNRALAKYTTISGGQGNTAVPAGATVGGGSDNYAAGNYVTISGGDGNRASGWYSAIPGGYADTCAGHYAMVMGNKVRATSSADFTFAYGEDFTTSTPRAVVFYHSGAATKLGVGVINPTHYVDVTGGSYCDASGWHNGSSRALKKDVSTMTADETRELAAQLEELELVRFRYRLQDDERLHVGVIAEDAPAVLVSADRDALSTGDAIGFLFAVAKAQQAEIDALKAELAGK